MRLAPILQSFFTDRLVIQRQASPATIAAYRDTFRLLLGWLAATTGTQPSTVDLGQLDVTVISAFLTYLQDERGNSTTTRNARLTAIRSLFHHAALQAPEHAESIARVTQTLRDDPGVLPDCNRGRRAARRTRPHPLARTP